jgi:hypothetical protein
MFSIHPKALTEAALVGGILAVFAWGISSQFKSPILEHFIAGALMHLTLELTGIHHHFQS